MVISLAFLLSKIKLDFLIPILEKYYAEKWRWKKFTPVSMLKLTIFRIMKRKDRCGIIRYLKINEQEAKLLGFKKCLPSPKTIWHWEKIRFGVKGFREIFQTIVLKIKELLLPLGIILGKIVCMDSTPIQSTRDDKDELAQFNGHYHLKMYKGDIQWDGILGIPLNFGINFGTGYDGHKAPSMIDQLFGFLKTIIETFIGDTHYNTIDNHFELTQKRGIKIVSKFPENHVFDEQGTVEALMEEYKKYWEDMNYIPPPVNFEHVLRFLSEKKPELVGRYHKNQLFEYFTNNPIKHHFVYGKRNHTEGGNGILKDRLNFHRLRENGRTNCEIHLAIHLIALLLTSPLLLLQNGGTCSLMKAQHYVS